MTFNIDVTNSYCKITTSLSSQLLAELRYECSFKMEGHEFKSNAYRNKGIDWDGSKKLFNIQSRRFPIGLLHRVTCVLKRHGDVTYTNKRKYSREKKQFVMANFQEREYQSRAVMTSVLHGNGVIKAATGSGKTTIAARTIGALGQWSIFIVHTRDLLYQTIESFKRMFPEEEIGQIGDGVFEYRPITVATMQSLAIIGNIKVGSNKYDEDNDNIKESKKYYEREEIKAKFKEYQKNVGTIMFDEVQLICSQTAFEVRFLFEYANNAFGYSASPWRDDGSDMMIEAAFGHRICDITASELIDLEYLVRPRITIKQVNNSTYTGKKYQEIYESAIVNNMMRNMQVSYDAYDQYCLGRNVLVLVNYIKHGETIEEILKSIGAPAIFISGKSRMKERKAVIQAMRDGKAPIVVATTIADVGLDVPRLDTVVEAGAGKSSVTALQRLGRVMRPFGEKKECYFITYRDRVPFLESQVDNKINIWRTEPNFIIEEQRAI